ncbi:MAG: hypothetical protein C0410_05600 [Anaerolinea sp.]|nr:hypothetical protein [Anaerolinea sp.]
MTETHLDRHLAAIALASEHGIGIAKYATSEDLATIRGASSPRPNSASAISPAPTIKRIVKSIEPITLDLTFVSSNELREILQRDVAELNVARSQGVDKTSKICMVLCGSIAETLLLDCLLQNQTAALAIASTLPRRPSSNLEDWELHEMVTVATRLNLLPDDASTGATQLRQWRNLIHPGRELKDARDKRIRPTPARAQNSISFLQFIAEELGR